MHPIGRAYARVEALSEGSFAPRYSHLYFYVATLKAGRFLDKAMPSMEPAAMRYKSKQSWRNEIGDRRKTVASPSKYDLRLGTRHLVGVGAVLNVMPPAHPMRRQR